MAVTPLHLSVPLRTGRGLNGREHPMARHRRVKAERQAVQWQMNGKPAPEGPVLVLLVRVAPSTGLDDDNLQGSLKAVRDQVAQWMGRDDGAASGIRWTYGQRRGARGEWAVEIHVTEAAAP